MHGQSCNQVKEKTSNRCARADLSVAPRNQPAALPRTDPGRRVAAAQATGQDPPLARALYAAVDLDEFIPPAHYEAVAKLIGFIMSNSARVVANARGR